MSNKTPASPVTLQAHGLTSIADVLKPVNINLGRGITVTPFVWQDVEGRVLMEFEVRVTRIGNVRVPRTAKTLPTRR